ncbi:MAG: phosphoglucosamine mutase [Ignavibacteria bacterium]|jgi:phosphomannomutase|nr:phosphoglucosamine mutase [Ignavibacteria bacterium]MDH7528404.1 phosphoglucosamine mutase [Ignavibacteria bacterium]
MATLIKSISGIRGIVGDGIDPQNLVRFSAAFAKFCNFGKIVVGRDSRISGEAFSRIVTGTLMASGCDVIDIGIVPTPTVQIYVEELKASGGIVLSASHNPNEWNALKLLNSEGTFLNPGQAKKFLEIEESYNPEFKKWDKFGKYYFIEKAYQLHIEKILNLDIINVDLIRSKKFKVLVDCVNGAGVKVVPELLEQLGCEITKINCEETGIFPRNPEPVPENLIETIKAAKAGNFDLTIIVDPDVDRLVLLQENGEPFIEEYTVVLATDFVLNKNKGNVCVNLSTTKAVEDVAKKYDCNVYRTPVGEINVVEGMKKYNAVIGGEGSGGVIYPAFHYGRDALVGIVFTLQYLAEKNKKLSEIKNELPSYFILKDKFQTEGIATENLIEKFKAHFAKHKINEDDGLRIDFEDHWIHLRKSNTEPIIRLIVEARSQKLAKELMDNYKNLLRTFINQ